MVKRTLPAVDLIDEYNANIDICLKDLLATIAYREHDTQSTYDDIAEELDGIEWVIETLQKAKSKLEAIQDRLDAEEGLGE